VPREWDGIVSQFINRKVSRPIAKLLFSHSSVTPNQVTAVSFVIGILSGLAFFPIGYVVIGGILAQLASILDGVDGDLAKLSNKVTRFGGFLDSLLDRYADVVVFAGMGAYSYYFEGHLHAVLFSIIVIIGALMVSYSRAASERIPGFSFRSPISNYLSNRDVRLFIVLIGSILSFAFATSLVPFITYTLILIAILTNVTVFRRAVEVSSYERKGRIRKS